MADDDAASHASDMDWSNFDIDGTPLESPDERIANAVGALSWTSAPEEASSAASAPSSSAAPAEASSAAPAPASNTAPTPEDALEIFEESDLDKTNMAHFFASVHEEGITTTPALLLNAVKNAHKCQVNPGANILVGPGVFHIVGSPPQASKTAFTMLLCLMDAILHGMPSIVMTMNRKTELERMELNLNHSSDYFAKYCRAIGTSATPGVRAIYPIGNNDRIPEYERCLKRWHERSSDECPIYFLLFNDKKMQLLKKVIGIIRGVVGVDSEARVRVGFKHDEGDQISKSCDRTSVTEKAMFGTTVVATSLLDSMSSVTFVTSTVPSLTLVPVPLGNRRPIFTDLEPSTNYVGYEESNRTGLQNTITRQEVDSSDDYIQFVSEQEGSHGGMVFIGGSTKDGVGKGRKQQAQAAAIQYRTTPGWCMIAWSSDEIHAFTADPVVVVVFRAAAAPFKEEPVFHPETHEDTGVFYFYYDGSNGKKGISDYPKLITFLIDGLPLNYLKTILFGKEMADRGTSICSTDHRHHLGSMYVEFTANSTDEMIRQAAGRLPCMLKQQPGQIVTISLCASAATHEMHQKAIRNSMLAADLLQKHFNGSMGSLDGTLKDFCVRVGAAQCDSVQDEASGAMIFAKSSVARGTLSTRSRKEVKEVEKAAKRRRVKILHTYQFGVQEEAAEIPAQQNAGPPGVQPMGQEEAAGPVAVQNEGPLVVQPPVQEEAAELPAQQNAVPSVVQPPVREEAVEFPVQQNEVPLLLPPLLPLLLTPPSRATENPVLGMQAELPVQQNAVRNPLQPVVRQATAGPQAPTGDPEVDMEELMLDHLGDFIYVMKTVLEDADEDSRMDGVGMHKMAREIQAKALYFGTRGANISAMAVVKYVVQYESDELAKSKVVFEANGQGGGVFKARGAR